MGGAVAGCAGGGAGGRRGAKARESWEGPGACALRGRRFRALRRRRGSRESWLLCRLYTRHMAFSSVIYIRNKAFSASLGVRMSVSSHKSRHGVIAPLPLSLRAFPLSLALQFIEL